MKRNLITPLLYKLKIAVIVIPIAIAAISVSCKNNPITKDTIKNGPIAEGTTGNLTWSIDKNGELTIAPTPPLTTAAMPNYEYIDDVAANRPPWHHLCSYITSVTIANGVTSIGNLAFYECSNITGKLVIPKKVRHIGHSAFAGCKGLTKVTVGREVVSIKSSAFNGCSGITAFSVPAANEIYASQNGILFNKSKTTLVRYPAAKQGAFTIPAGVNSIESYAFSYCTGATSLTIPDGVTSIGSYAFARSSLTSVTIGKGITTIGSDIFKDCTNLTSITIPDWVTSIEHGAFSGCTGLINITIPNEVTQPFSSCTLYLPKTNTGYNNGQWNQFTNRIENL